MIKKLIFLALPLVLSITAYAQTVPTDTAKKNVNNILQDVNITAKPPLIRQERGKLIVDVAASPTNSGSTVLDVLERSPGVTVDRNGGISLQGKAGVLVMIDDKLTYLSGSDLNNLLSSMSADQIAQIELITNPTAQYDASGNAGIIDIKTKKTKQVGFNGSFTIAAGHGVYPKDNNSLMLNYKAGKISTFFNYSINYQKYLTDLYALRKYYDTNDDLTSILDQPSYLSGSFVNNTLKTGLDYSISDKTTVGFLLGGTIVNRNGNNLATVNWLNPAGALDSAIYTTNRNSSKLKNGSVNLNLRHTISSSQSINADVDLLHYVTESNQSFNNQLLANGGYNQRSRGNIPTTINIISGKVDHTLGIGKDGTLKSGIKASYTNTDNLASYQNFINENWTDDLTKSNHFVYKENIHAIYSTFEKKFGKISLQAGVRYENTGYNANQYGNALQKDSSFARNYGGLFPSGYVNYQVDSLNSFTFTAGRRIDRPVFQNLNPFYFIINKYTYQTGNPYILPQYSWNLELSHQYNNVLTTAISYSSIENYFSQLFLADATKGILLYTQGNVGRTYNIGLSSTLAVSPFSWWTLTAQAVFNHKQLKGFNGNNYTTDIDQLNVSANNQFTIAKVYTVEVSGFYTSRARNDVQELLYPTGQLSAGISKPIFKKKATLRFTARDILYTNAMSGLTDFPGATEYFKIRRDTRVFTVSFTYRFGKSYKTTQRTSGSASDEMERVGGS